MMMNPVLRREAITTLRTKRAYATLTLYVAANMGVVALYLFAMLSRGSYSFDPQNMNFLYLALAAMQLAFIFFSVPALSAGSISGERERQTLDLLLVTDMTPFSIVLGKLMASIAMVLLMTVATLPVYGLLFYFGSLAIGQILGMVAFLLISACMAGAISIFFSCVFRRTVISIMLVYIIFGFLCFGTLIAVFMTEAVYQSTYQQSMPVFTGFLILLGNPLAGFFSLAGEQLGTNLISNMFGFYWGGYSDAMPWYVEYFYLLHLLFDAVVILLFLLFAVWAVNPLGAGAKHRAPKERKEKKQKKQKNSAA